MISVYTHEVISSTHKGLLIEKIKKYITAHYPCFPQKKRSPTARVRLLFSGAGGGTMPLRVIRPCGTAAADFAAENSPPDCFLHAAHPLRVRVPQ